MKFKRQTLIISAFLILSGSLYFLMNTQKAVISSKKSCPFCNPEVLDRQNFYEDDLIFVLYTHLPVIESHFLIIPKRHIESFEYLSEEELLRIHQVIPKIKAASSKVFQTSSYLLHQKNGIEVHQSVPHIHFHFIAKKPGDSSVLKFLYNLILVNFKSPLSPYEMQKNVQKMKAAIDSINLPRQEELKSVPLKHRL
ncbi:MAG: hypothetical protein S4CHLAM20_11350 [Chlamydiia bacterium]|nr:hypothetical protein [Chlamydiia bacterium]